jgi:hypothetical protein
MPAAAKAISGLAARDFNRAVRVGWVLAADWFWLIGFPSCEASRAADGLITGISLAARDAAVCHPGNTAQGVWPGSHWQRANGAASPPPLHTQAGLDAPYSCRQGACGACACRLTGGEVERAHDEVLEAAGIAGGYILACQAVSLTPEVSIAH